MQPALRILVPPSGDAHPGGGSAFPEGAAESRGGRAGGPLRIGLARRSRRIGRDRGRFRGGRERAGRGASTRAALAPRRLRRRRSGKTDGARSRAGVDCPARGGHRSQRGRAHGPFPACPHHPHPRRRVERDMPEEVPLDDVTERRGRCLRSSDGRDRPPPARLRHQGDTERAPGRHARNRGPSPERPGDQRSYASLARIWLSGGHSGGGSSSSQAHICRDFPYRKC